MKKDKDIKKEMIKKKPTKQKLVVSQGSVFIGNPIEYKILYTETVSDREVAKIREKELKEEYKNIEAVSVNYFSL